jgi:repressor LexA
MSAQPKVTNDELLNIIIGYITTHNYPPTTRELMQLTDIKSTSTMHYRLLKLRENGLIDFEDCEPRTISVTGYRYVKE